MEFLTIPLGMNLPGQVIEFSNERAVQGTPAMPNKILVLAQMLATGTAAPNVPVLIPASGVSSGLFGRGSMMNNIINAIQKVNPYTPLWAIGIPDNPAGVAATGSVNFTAPATAAGTFNLYMSGELVQIPVAAGQSVNSLATELQAAIAANPDLPAAAAVDGVTASKVNITYNHKGLVGNSLDLRANYYSSDATPAGLTFAITPMSGGTANPSLTAAIAAMGDDWYNHIIGPYTDGASLTAINAELLRRFGPTVMKEGLYYSALNGSVGALTTFGLSQNSQFPVVMATQNSPTEIGPFAGVLGGLIAYYSNIDPGRPLQNLQMTGILAPARQDRFVWQDRNNLVGDGISSFKVDEGGNVIMERVVTMYRVNPDGVPDPSYQSIEKVLTLFYLRYSLRTRIALRFPRYKLAKDGTTFDAGQAVATPSIIRNEIISWFSEQEAAGLVQDIDQFKNDIQVVIDSNNPDQADALIPPHVIDQFRIFAGQIQFII